LEEAFLIAPLINFTFAIGGVTAVLAIYDEGAGTVGKLPLLAASLY